MADGSKKYEREIAEILERMEKDEPRGERVARQARHSVRERFETLQRKGGPVRGLGQGGGTAAAWTWMGLTVAAGITGLVLSQLVPVLGPLLGLLCGIGMVGLFFSPLFRRSGPQASPSTLWRGQIIDLPPRGGLLATLGYYWRRFRHGRRF